MDENRRSIKDVRFGFGEGETAPESFPVMPLKVVALAELNPRGLTGSPSPAGTKRIQVDRSSFNDVLKEFSLRLSLAVRDRLGGSPEPLILDIPLPDLKSFRPEAVALHIPGARGLLALRENLEALRQGKTTYGEVHPRLAALAADPAVPPAVRQALAGSETRVLPSPPPASAPLPGGLESLLAQVDAPSSAAAGAAMASLDGFIKDLVRSGGHALPLDSKTLAGAIQALDTAITAQTAEVTGHPEFQRLEAAWRGLRFFIERTDFEKEIRLEVVATGRETLLQVFDELVYGPESQGISPEPIGFILVDQPFQNTPQDLETLQALAERGAALSAPVLAVAGAGLLGLEPGQERLPDSLRQRFGTDAYAKWRGLRESGPSRWLGLIFNRFLLREGLWGNPSWAFAVLAVRSFARSGWCTDLMGQRPSGTLEDLPLRELSIRSGEPVPFPLEFLISDQSERDLTEAGVMTLSAAPGTDKAFLRFAPSVHAPAHYQDPLDKARAKLQSTLPFQMFVGRVINFALLIERQIVPGRTGDQVTAAYTEALRSLIGTAGAVPADAVQVEVLAGEQDPSTHDLKLKLRWPGFQSLPGAGDLELRWPLVG